MRHQGGGNVARHRRLHMAVVNETTRWRGCFPPQAMMEIRLEGGKVATTTGIKYMMTGSDNSVLLLDLFIPPCSYSSLFSLRPFYPYIEVVLCVVVCGEGGWLWRMLIISHRGRRASTPPPPHHPSKRPSR